MLFSQAVPDGHPLYATALPMASSHYFTQPRRVPARLAPPMWFCALPLLPRRGHPHGRLCTTPILVSSVCCEYEVHFHFLWLSEWTLNISPFLHRFGAYKETIISRFLTLQSRAPLTSHTSILSTIERSGIPYHRGGLVGVPAACRALCPLLCWTLWLLPRRAHPHGRLCTTP